MKKHSVLLVFILLSFQFSFTQTKVIQGDTTWINNYFDFLKSIDLKDFQNSTDEFNFRFRNHGQVVEISKDSSNYYGCITNYIYHFKQYNNEKSEILTSKIVLTSKQSEDVYNYIQKSKIIELPSSNKIKKWKWGVDGISYTIEHSDKRNYWLKSYWSPSFQDSIPEAIIVSDLVKYLSDSLNLQDKYVTFENTLPKKGCYNSGGIYSRCYSSNSIQLGYNGATKLPLGFNLFFWNLYIGNKEINSSIKLQYYFDNKGFHQLNTQYTKWNLFYKKEHFSDFIFYNYQHRILNINHIKRKFQNQQIVYGLNLKYNISLGVGLDYIGREYNKVGGLVYASKWFSKGKINSLLSFSLFNNQINYKAEVNKNFKFLLKRNISIGIAFEEFMNYNDLYFNIKFLL